MVIAFAGILTHYISDLIWKLQGMRLGVSKGRSCELFGMLNWGAVGGIIIFAHSMGNAVRSSQGGCILRTSQGFVLVPGGDLGASLVEQLVVSGGMVHLVG